MERRKSRQHFVDTTGKYGFPKAGPPLRPRGQVPGGGIPGQVPRGSTARPRPPAGQLPKTLPVSAKPWVTLGKGMARRLFGVAGAVLTPTPTADATFDGVRYGRPRPRPAVEDPKTNTGRAPVRAKRGRLGGRLPDPAVEKSLRRAKADKDLFRIPKTALSEVSKTVVSDKLDKALDRPRSPSTFETPEISARKAEKLERKRKARKARNRATKPEPSRPAPARPAPKPKPVTTPTKPVTSPKPAGGTGGAKPPVSAPSKPVTKPVVTPAPPFPASKPKPVVQPKPVVPGTKPIGSGPSPSPVEPGPIPEPITKPDLMPMYPEVILEPQADGSGVRIRTRQVRAPARPRREKDQKARGRRAELLHEFVTTAWGEYTEWQDLWDILRGNLYVQWDKKVVYGDQLSLTDREVVQAWARGDLELDIEGLLVDFVVNKLEDAVIGRLSSSLDKAIIEAGYNPNEITMGQRLNWLRRTVIQGGTNAVLS